MAIRAEIGWQTDKTLAECMRYMLDKEIATDVCFEVGPPDGDTVSMQAHRCILSARSPVFEAMFSTGMIECRAGKDEKIRIVDVEADDFRALLSFVYSDSADIFPETALSLMYTAKKYMFSKLVKECNNVLKTSMKAENVCFLLDQSFLLVEENLRDNCLEFISLHSDEVLKHEALLDVSAEAMGAILKIEKMRSSESVVYQSCVNWAKHQLRIQLIEDPSDEQIRETLDQLLYDIRFPTMDPTEFADQVANGNVLTADEKLSIYSFLIKKQEAAPLRFKTDRRLLIEKVVDRVVSQDRRNWYRASLTDGIDFKVDTDTYLTGLGLYAAWDGKQYDIDVEVRPLQVPLKKRFTIPFTGDTTPFRISFESPILIRAGISYTIGTFAHDTTGYNRTTCRAVCKVDEVTFTFSEYDGKVAKYNDTGSQIPQLYFLN